MTQHQPPLSWFPGEGLSLETDRCTREGGKGERGRRRVGGGRERNGIELVTRQMERGRVDRESSERKRPHTTFLVHMERQLTPVNYGKSDYQGQPQCNENYQSTPDSQNTVHLSMQHHIIYRLTHWVGSINFVAEQTLLFS